jgi:beta-galactosidase
MWFHLELKDKGYSAARAGVATSKSPTGPYTFVRDFRPDGEMSRDMTLYKDDDGKAYLITTSENNQTQHLSSSRTIISTPPATTPASLRTKL